MDKLFDSKVFKVAIYTVVIISLLFVSVNNAFAGDAEAKKYTYDSISKNNVGVMNCIEVTQGTPGDVSQIKSDATSVGIDTLYGLNPRGFDYFGEVFNPLSSADGISSEANDKIKDYPHMRSTGRAIEGNFYRVWYNQPNHLQDNINWDSSETNDLHVENMTRVENAIVYPILRALSGVAFNLIALINSLFNALVKFEIWLSNIDLSLFSTTIVGDLGNELNKLFIMDGTNPSPLLALSVAMFVIGFAVMTVRFLTSGGTSIRAVFQEFGYLILGMLVAAAAMTGAIDNMTTSLSKFSSNLVGAISSDAGSNFKLYKYEMKDQIQAANMTEFAISNKPYVDLLIKNQFGCSVEELELNGENWGMSDDELANIINNITTDGGVDLFVVNVGSTWDTSDTGHTNKGVGGSASYGNLGYYWYAASTDTNIKNPFSADGDTIKLNKDAYDDSSETKMLFITDFLAAVDAQNEGSNKAQSIMRNFEGSYYDFIGMFMLLLVSVMLFLALLVGVLMAAFGKLVFNVFIVFIAILPILIITPIKNVRAYSKQFVFTWLISGLKMVVGLVFVMAVLMISGILCQQGYIGYLLDIIFLFVVFRFGPKLFVAINNAVNSTELGREQLGFTRDIDRAFNNAATSAQSRRGVFATMNRAKDRRAELLQDMKTSSGIENKHGMLAADAAVDDLLNNFGNNGEATGSGVNGGITISDDNYEEISNLKQQAADKIDALNEKDDATLAEEFGINNQLYLDVARNVEVNKLKLRAIESDNALRRDKELNWRLSTKGKMLSSIPGISSVLAARSAIFVDKKIGNIDIDFKKKNVKAALEWAEIHKHNVANNQIGVYEDSNGERRTANISQIMAVKKEAEVKKITDGLKTSVLKLNREGSDTPQRTVNTSIGGKAHPNSSTDNSTGNSAAKSDKSKQHNSQKPLANNTKPKTQESNNGDEHGNTHAKNFSINNKNKPEPEQHKDVNDSLGKGIRSNLKAQETSNPMKTDGGGQDNTSKRVYKRDSRSSDFGNVNNQ